MFQNNNIIITHHIQQKESIQLTEHQQNFQKDNSLTEAELPVRSQNKSRNQNSKVFNSVCSRITVIAVFVLLFVTILAFLITATNHNANNQKGPQKQTHQTNTNDNFIVQIPKNNPSATPTPPSSVSNNQSQSQYTPTMVPITNPLINQKEYLHTPTRQHTHQILILDYPTMGIPKPGDTFNFKTVSNAQLYKYQDAMVEIFHPYNDTDCQLERYGDGTDGGYLLCVEGRDLFGCELTSAFTMPNYQYDCTNGGRPTCQTNNNNNYFQFACLGQKTEKTSNTQFYSLKDIVDSRNLTKQYVTMKIDIEGGEWPGFRTFPIQYLDYVDQFVLQIHNPGHDIYQSPFWGNDDIIRSLGDKFVSVNLHMNNFACLAGYSDGSRRFPSFAIEVTMVNKKLIKLKSNSRSYALHPKNHPNSYSRDCQMTK